jgi:hypothetical protein
MSIGCRLNLPGGVRAPPTLSKETAMHGFTSTTAAGLQRVVRTQAGAVRGGPRDASGVITDVGVIPIFRNRR